MRKTDAGLAIAHLFLAGTAFTTDVWAWTGRIHGDDLLAQGLAGYAESDPLFGLMPPWLQGVMFLSTFLFGPMNIALAYGLWRERDWLRPLSLVSAGAQAMASWTYLLANAIGEPGPNDWAIVLAMNGPYSLIPITTAIWAHRRRVPRPTRS